MFQGKSLFQSYLLVRLLQQKQVVLFTLNCSEFYLFYHDGVYVPNASVAAVPRRLSLPEFKSNDSKPQGRGYIWSLLDTLESTGPPSDLVCLPCLPVQATSPNPNRYKLWRTQYNPLLTGLPLWSHEELAQALPYQGKYCLLLDALASQNETDHLLARFPGARELLDEHGEDAAPLSPPDALNYLLDAAIDRFGYSARDVFNGVFDYIGTTQEHESAIPVSYSGLDAAVTAFSKENSTLNHISNLNRIVALMPHYHEDYLLGPVTWTIDFKSRWVAKNVFEALDHEKETVIRRHINLLQHNPQTRGMAGSYFEPLAHRILVRTSTHTGTGSDGDSNFWQLVNMVSDHTDSPRFIMPAASKSSGDIQLTKVERKVHYFHSLPERLENKTYYIPVAHNFPLVDAYIVDLDPLKRVAILWALQITTSSSHKGSAIGYQHVRKIIAHLKGQLGEGPPPNKKTRMKKGENPRLVEVRYVLVVSDVGGSEESREDLSWQFPPGWNENCKMNDHRGQVYCLKIRI